MDAERSMKPLLAVAITEACELAFADSILPGEGIETMSRDAFAQNLCCRLLGTGGWQIGDLYTPNATPQEILDASIDRTHRDPLGDLTMELFGAGVKPADIVSDPAEIRQMLGDDEEADRDGR